MLTQAKIVKVSELAGRGRRETTVKANRYKFKESGTWVSLSVGLEETDDPVVILYKDGDVGVSSVRANVRLDMTREQARRLAEEILEKLGL